MFSRIPIRLKLLLLHALYFVCVIIILGAGIFFLLRFTDVGASDVRTLIIIYTVGILITAVFISLYAEKLKKAVIYPVKKIENALRQLAKGDINVRFEHHNSDEMGDLAEGLNLVTDAIRFETDLLVKVAEGDYTERVELRSNEDEMFMALNQIVNTINTFLVDIRNMSQQINSAAEQVATSSQSLALGATTQSNSVESVSGSIKNVSGLAVDSSEKTSVMLGKMDDNATIAQEIMSDMEKMKNAMNEITSSSQKVASVTKIIDDISFQTNILALNAAVEAARAGQHGKGFAVVADEVRSLASKSADAAKETNDLIQQSIASIKVGNKIVESTGERTKTLQEILMSNKAETIELAEKANTQFNTINEIDNDMLQFTDVIHANAAMAEESSAAAEELSAQVEYLNDRLSVFKI